MKSPQFFSFDGVDGAGKSTQIRLFCDWLKELGHDVVTCRDPGTSALGERIREVLLQSGDETPICNEAEMLLYMAARAQLVQTVIQPALKAGSTVVSDRYLLASVAYQGYGGAVDLDGLRQVGAVATGGLMPSLTFVLDVDPQVAATRRSGEPDRVEQRSADYFRKVRDGFLREAELHPQEIVVVDATQAIEQVKSDIRAAAEKVLQ